MTAEIIVIVALSIFMLIIANFNRLSKPKNNLCEEYNLIGLDIKKISEEPKPEIQKTLITSLKPLKQENKTKVKLRSIPNIEKKMKKELLDDFFKDAEGIIYNRSSEFEKQEFENAQQTRRFELENEEFKFEIKSSLFDQDKKLFSIEQENKNMFFSLQKDIQEGMYDLKHKLINLEKNITTLSGYFEKKFNHLHLKMCSSELELKEKILNLREGLKTELTDMKLNFGKEVLRLDNTNLQLLDQLANYSNSLKSFSLEMEKQAIESERFQFEGKKMLSKAELLFDKNLLQNQEHSNMLELGLNKIANSNIEFANAVGKAKLMMEEISNQQYFALKDAAYEKIGINYLRKENQQKLNIEKMNIYNQRQEIASMAEKIRIEQSHGNEIGHLKHRLQMTQENLNYNINRANQMSREHAIIRRLSK